MRDLKPTTKTPQFPRPNSDSTTSIIRRALVLLSLYLFLGVVIYSLNRDHFSGTETHPVVDALYFCIVTMMGALVLYSVEDMDWIDSIYLAVMSVTTVGYGDRAFKTLPGRLFAAAWLLVSTLAVARAFLYLAEFRVDKRHRRITNWVLHRDITVEDLLAADMNNTGFISKSEYVIYKLKEMGKIGEKDISQICNQFKKLDPNNLGKITLPDLLENHL
ncbi:Two pore potassium channel c [Linum perenne]